MCVGGGGAKKSAEDYYEEMKITPDDLPSLTVDKGKVRNLFLKDAPKPMGGMQGSSLLKALKSRY